MFAKMREAWRAWRERSRQAAIDRAVYKAGGGSKQVGSDKHDGPPLPPNVGIPS